MVKPIMKPFKNFNNYIDNHEWLWKYTPSYIIPYEWQLSTIWSKIKYRLWKKPHIIKCRYLSKNTWSDPRNKLIDAAFETLSFFIEKECSPGHVEWYGGYGHKITVDEKEKSTGWNFL